MATAEVVLCDTVRAGRLTFWPAPLLMSTTALVEPATGSGSADGEDIKDKVPVATMKLHDSRQGCASTDYMMDAAVFETQMPTWELQEFIHKETQKLSIKGPQMTETVDEKKEVHPGLGEKLSKGSSSQPMKNVETEYIVPDGTPCCYHAGFRCQSESTYIQRFNRENNTFKLKHL